MVHMDDGERRSEMVAGSDRRQAAVEVWETIWGGEMYRNFVFRMGVNRVG